MTIWHGGLFSELKRCSLRSQVCAEPNEYTDRHTFDATMIDANPCSAIRTIDDLPDTCILQILQLLNITELCHLRLVNRHLNRIIQRHHEVLAKKHIQGMTIYSLPNGELSFDMNFYNHPHFVDNDELDGTVSCGSVFEFSLKHMCLDSALRHVNLCDCLCIESARFDHALRHSLQRSFKGPLRRMEFIDCTINIRYDEFVAFIRRLRVNELALLLCELEDAQLIGDDLFNNNTQLDFVAIQFGVLQDLPLLTNDTLRHWSAGMTWPSSLLLHNVKSCFDIVGIGLMIESYFLYCYRREDGGHSCGNLPILWNFGTVDTEINEALITLRSLGDRALILESEANKLAVIVRFSPDSPPLHVRLQCKK